ncbi:MAG: esterase/lipase family protein [Bacillota bacterium]
MKTTQSAPFSVITSTLSFLQGGSAQTHNIYDLNRKEERRLLGPRYEGRLIPMESIEELSAAREEPLIFVRGQSGSAKRFTELLHSAPKLAQYKLFYFAYDDLHRSLRRSALDLAHNLISLRAPRITLLAHSMGGIIAREALNILARFQLPENVPELRVITIDTPWQGGALRRSSYKETPLDNLVEAFLPATASDMRSCSEFFKNLYATPWPEKFSMELYFAERGEQAYNYSEAPLNKLPQKIADLFSNNIPMTGSLLEMHFWNALTSSAQYPFFVSELAELQERASLKPESVRALLEKHFPRFPGDHSSVLASHPGAKMDLPSYLQQIL